MTGAVTICGIFDIIAALWIGIVGWESSWGLFGCIILLFICIILNVVTLGEWMGVRKKKKAQE